ncbi:hypothetical protein F3Y22_tig00110177pilonHSYRG00003 [Hibiscus syriacus]|uniref:Uncharacterized protein n=1 Tax=Hibiscus syriacus TaxID=106335 RepID=A0A6A3BKF0_HIBSY|nr:hypothetical protein F3Y22_tig00110177pilonHSYRG00003 [Hibiscus syriacus]
MRNSQNLSTENCFLLEKVMQDITYHSWLKFYWIIMNIQLVLSLTSEELPSENMHYPLFFDKGKKT